MNSPEQLPHLSTAGKLHNIIFVTLGFLVLASTACGGRSGSKSTTPVVPVVTVSVSPQSTTLSVNATQTFAATVTGTSNATVTWSVTESNGGAIDSTGKYTAAPKAGIYHVVATSQANFTASASAAVTVTAPAPTFSSIAPTAASEGSPYTYTISAVDPAESNLSFALANAPNGAVLNGNTVIWTQPTAAQSRVANNFTVIATSSAGGSSSQSWSVSPNGTIYGACIDNYWTATGKPTCKRSNDRNVCRPRAAS